MSCFHCNLEPTTLQSAAPKTIGRASVEGTRPTIVAVETLTEHRELTFATPQSTQDSTYLSQRWTNEWVQFANGRGIVALEGITFQLGQEVFFPDQQEITDIEAYVLKKVRFSQPQTPAFLCTAGTV